MVCSEATLPAVRSDAGREFVEGIKEGLSDFAEGKYKVFTSSDELLDYLLGL